MKKWFASLLILMLSALGAFAQTPPAPTAQPTFPAPTVTGGFEGEYGYNIAQDNVDSTFALDKDAVPEGRFLPFGSKVTGYKLAPWVNMDWSLMSIKVETVYDAFNSTDEDWSKVVLATTWKDFFGFSILHEVQWDNEDETLTTDQQRAAVTLDHHTITTTLDKTKEMGFKFFTKWNAVDIFNLFTTDFGYNLDEAVSTAIDTVGIALDTEFLAADLQFKPNEKDDSNTEPQQWDVSWVEARKLFGIWTVRANDESEITLRLADLDSDVTIDRTDFGIGWYDESEETAQNIAKGTGGMNVLNTVVPLEGLTLKLATVTPTTDVTMQDWFLGYSDVGGDWQARAAVSGTYDVKTVGTFGAGAWIGGVDYLVNDGTTQGPSQLVGATLADHHFWGPALWFDANLSPLVGTNNKLFVSLDGQIGEYNQLDKSDVDEVTAGTIFKTSLVAEYATTIEAFELMAAARVSLGFGYNYDSVYGNGFDAPDSTNAQFFSSSFTEANFVNSGIYGITPLEVNLKASYTINPENKVWLLNKFHLNNIDFQNADNGFDAFLSDAAVTGLVITDADAATVDVFGFGSTNTVELGYEVKANAASTLTFTLGYNLYLGLPTAGDLSLDTNTNDQDKVVAAEYADWLSAQFNPWSLSASYSFKY